MTNPYEINVSKYVALIGHVQSGKTIEEINYTYQSINQNIPVVFIVRNITADQLQLKDRFNLCEKKLNVKILSHLSHLIQRLVSRPENSLYQLL